MRALTFTVVTPCLEPGPRLERCLASIRTQDVAVEHIVIDGGSKDGTTALLAAHADVVTVSEPDSGAAEAINKGFGLASGDLVGWIGADDFLLPGALHHVARAAREYPTVGYFYGDVLVVDGGVVVRRRGARRVTRDRLGWDNPLPQPGSFLRRAALDTVGPLDESLHLAFDVDLWIRLALAGIAGRRLRTDLAVFEVHPASKTGSASIAAWLREEASARRHHGLTDGAAFYGGRLAAHAAIATGRSLEVEVDLALASLDLDPRAYRRLALASAAAETVVTHPDWRRRARAVLTPSVWMTRSTRRSALARASWRIRRLFSRRRWSQP